MGDKKYCTEQADKEGYEPVKCEKCGFIMCSSLLEGGGSTGGDDYNDPTCPICGSHNIDDYDGPYVDQSEFLFNKLKAMDANWDNLYWGKEGELLDWQSKHRWWILDQHVRPEPAKQEDNVVYLTLPDYRPLRWFDNSFWTPEQPSVGCIMVSDTKITHWCRIPELPK